jgi:hypothetical protein
MRNTLILSGIVALAATATLSPPVMAQQGKTDSAKESLAKSAYATQDLINSLSPQNRFNFTSIRIDKPTDKVEIRWKGKVPDELTRRLADQGLANSVRISEARYNYSELDSAVLAATDATAKSTTLLGRTFASEDVVSAAPKADGSGVTVEVKEGALSGLNRSKAEEVATGGEVNTPSGSVQADFTPAEASLPIASRLDLPNAGGHLIRTATAGSCTAGFTVFNSAGKQRMLTAAHCARKGQSVHGSSGQLAGRVETSNASRDVALFDNSGMRLGFTPKVIGGGPYNRSDQKTYDVSYSQSAIVGGAVCVSGAVSGEVCNAEVVQRGGCETTSGVRVCGLFRIETYAGPNQNPVALAGGGDSGGPVYIKYSSNSTSVIATGMMSFIKNGRAGTCRFNNDSGRLCSHIVMAVDLAESMKVVGARGVYVTR